MILPWNRKEAYLGFSLVDFSKVKETLSNNGIRYSIRMRYITSTMYYVYVHRKDYEKACYLLGRVTNKNL